MTEEEVRIPPDAEDAHAKADAFVAEFWKQIAGAAWRYFRKLGRGAVVISWAPVQRFTEGNPINFGILYTTDGSPEDYGKLIQAYDPYSKIVALFVEPDVFEAIRPGEPQLALGQVTCWIFARPLPPPVADLDPSREETEWAVQQAVEFKARLDQRLPLVTTLVDDIRIAHERLDRASQTDRRSYVRTTFALVEGLIACMKQTLLDSNELLGVSLSAGELSLLREQRYSLDRNGEIDVGRQDLRIAENFRFSVRMLQRVYGAHLEIDYGGQPWEHFRAAIGTRNRLTHPRSPESCIVSDSDFESVEWAVGLFKGVSVAFFQAIHTVFKVKGQQIAADLVRRRRGREDVSSTASGETSAAVSE